MTEPYAGVCSMVRHRDEALHLDAGKEIFRRGHCSSASRWRWSLKRLICSWSLRS